jgi:hypothetical protein
MWFQQNVTLHVVHTCLELSNDVVVVDGQPRLTDLVVEKPWSPDVVACAPLQLRNVILLASFQPCR